MVTLILRGDWADLGARAGSGKAFSNLPGARLPNQRYLLPPVLICVNIFFLRDVVNLGRTKFVSTMIKEGVVFYVTLPHFWVDNLLDVEPEMRWVGPICNYSMTKNGWKGKDAECQIFYMNKHWNKGSWHSATLCHRLWRDYLRNGKLQVGQNLLKMLPTARFMGLSSPLEK